MPQRWGGGVSVGGAGGGGGWAIADNHGQLRLASSGQKGLAVGMHLAHTHSGSEYVCEDPEQS